MSRKLRVVVAMSGGVDSGTTAALLKEQGHEVIGITMRLYSGPSHCCGTGDVEDARRTAAHLEIPFYVLNYENEFSSGVIHKFVDEYIHGRTPNPCILCNQNVKFDDLLTRAESLGADYLATGHYSQIQFDEAKGKYKLFKAADPQKDQSYVLFSMTQKQLAKTLFPLGGFSKQETRMMANQWDLPVANKAESQDICFVPDKDYASFVEKWLSKHSENETVSIPQGGLFVDTKGNQLGNHQGIHHYTVGQRSGLGIATGTPLYVTDINPELNKVTLGHSEEVFRKSCKVSAINWISGVIPEKPIQAIVKIRYKHDGAEAEILVNSDNSANITFKTPQRAITPGQAAVFYDGDSVLGGGWINNSF